MDVVQLCRGFVGQRFLDGLLEVHRPQGAPAPSSLIALRLDFEAGAISIGGAPVGEGLVTRELSPDYDMDQYGGVEHDPLVALVVGQPLRDVTALRHSQTKVDIGVALSFGEEEVWIFCLGDELRCELASSPSSWMAEVSKATGEARAGTE